jgi:hypothetical protein
MKVYIGIDAIAPLMHNEDMATLDGVGYQHVGKHEENHGESVTSPVAIDHAKHKTLSQDRPECHCEKLVFST